MSLTSKLAITGLALGAFAALPASAGILLTSGAPIGTLYNTGVDATGAPQPNNSAELHYTLTSSPDTIKGVRVATSANGFPIGPWLGDDATSAWIGPIGSSDLTGSSGTYTYHTTFSLAGFDPSTASISGDWATDDNGMDILLNGHSLGITAGGFGAFTPFTIAASNSFFVNGVNSLDFVVYNSGGPTGLRTELSGTASVAAVPESATWAMMLAGFGIVGFGMRTRKRKAPRVTYA
jgi:hypothetical protein